VLVEGFRRIEKNEKEKKKKKKGKKRKKEERKGEGINRKGREEGIGIYVALISNQAQVPQLGRVVSAQVHGQLGGNLDAARVRAPLQGHVAKVQVLASAWFAPAGRRD
jgi:hypothetical protein